MTTLPKLAIILTAVSTPEQAADKKQSLDTQERDLRAIAEQRGWRVLDVLRIPGFSRDYISWEECAADMRKVGITAMDDLKRYCTDESFDVFMIRDADRFGRSQSLVMQVAETIGIKMGRLIYSQIDGLIEPTNCRMWAMMAGWRSAGEMDKKKIYHAHGMEKRAENGFHENHTPWYHRSLRDPDTGKVTSVEVREEYRYFWDAVYEALVVERVGFHNLEKHLYEEYQIVHPQSGRKLRRNLLHELLCTMPAFWGHRMRGKREYMRTHNRYPPAGEWVFNVNINPPEGIRLFYNVLPAVYTGQQAVDMQDELRRRFGMKGGNRPDSASPFSGLVVCDYCHYTMTHLYNKRTSWRAFRCLTFEQPSRIRSCAAASKSIKHRVLAAWVDEFLTHLLTGASLESVFTVELAASNETVISIEQQIETVEREARQLVERIGLVPSWLLPQIQGRIREVDNRLTALRARQRELKIIMSETDQTRQARALDRIKEMGLTAFWDLETGQQNQLLKLLFGKWRIVVADSQIIGVKKIDPDLSTDSVS